MNYPTSGERVRVSGRVQDHSVFSADYVARVAAISSDGNGSSVHETVRFDNFFESTDGGILRTDTHVHARRLASVEQVLHSSEAHIHRGTVMIADIADTISTTMQAIRSSQKCIYESDLVIARSKTLGSE